MSRAVGETAPVIAISALVYLRFVPDGPLSRFTVLPIQIYNWVARPQEDFRGLAAAGIIVLLTLFLGAGYFLYSELQTLSTEVDNALTVIADIQSLLPKLEVAVDTVISLETAFQSLAGISDLLTILLDPLQGNS